MNGFLLPSGLTVDEPFDRLQRFCAEEYPYYDAIPSSHPDRVEPLDVVATVAMNSHLSAAGIRRVHRWMSEHCELILSAIPEQASLLTADEPLLVSLQALLE